MGYRRFFYPSILYVNFLTLLLCLIGTVGTMMRGPDIPLLRIADIVVILALAAALLYVLRGARKKDVNYLRLLLLVCAAAEAAGLWGSILIMPRPFLPILVLNGIRCLLYLVLALKHDLGRQLSLILAVCAVLISLLGLIAVLIRFPQITADGMIYSAFTGFRAASLLELSIVSLLCVWFKYQDKEERKRTAMK